MNDKWFYIVWNFDAARWHVEYDTPAIRKLQRIQEILDSQDEAITKVARIRRIMEESEGEDNASDE